MKQVFGLLIVIVLVALISLDRKFQPWMSAGRAVQVSSEHLGDYDFQVWQRKNAGVTEPFATGLFARKQGGQWQAFLLDFEDTYHPPIALRKEDSGVAVLRGNKKLGVFDETQQTFKRDSDGASFTGAALNAEPPGNWWLTPETKASVPRKGE